jgi:intraflagellar transport protein 172
LFVSKCVSDGKYDVAATSLVKYGSPAHDSLFDAYRLISNELLKRSNPQTATLLRDMLYALVSNAPNKLRVAQFSNQLLISHLLSLKTTTLKNPDLNPVTAKIAIALLRYTEQIPADLAFLEAGQCAKNAGMNNMAFICWNRFLDLCEVIEDGDPTSLENTDFANTDVPFNALLSKSLVEVNLLI